MISAIIAFSYFYWHTATFIFPFCLAFGYFLFEQFYGKKPDWKKIIFPLAGTIAAVFLAYAISPGIVDYLKNVIFPVFFDTTISKTVTIAEGSEVYGRNFFVTFNTFLWFLVPMIIAGSYELFRYVQTKRGLQNAEDEIDMKIQPLRMMLFVAAITFLAASSLSGRFLDYFVYFSFLYVVIAFSDIVKFFEIRGKLFHKSFVTGIVIISIYIFVGSSLNFYDSLGGANSFLVAQGPAEWLNTHAQKNQIIFNAEWDSFPMLYYFTGDRFRYVIGLEPRFLYSFNPKMYWIWNNIGNGIYCEESDCSKLTDQRDGIVRNGEIKNKWYENEGNLIANAVLNDFKTDIIVASNGKKQLLAVMDNSPRFKKEFFDDKNSAYAVYRIIK